MSETNHILNVGIDLGTSHSAISASNGQRHVVDSYVGWPVDMVARKILKRSVLIGQEALENRTMLDLRRPLERGLIKEGSEKDAAAVHALLQHVLALVGVKADDPERPQVRAVVGVPAEALRVSKQHLRQALKGVADRLMIVSEPFAVAYGLNALVHTLIIDIGAGTTDFCVMKGRYPTDEDQRTLDMAGDAIDLRLHSLLRERHPTAQFSMHMVREWKEKWSFVGTTTTRAMVTVPMAGKPTRLDITQEIRAACESLVPPVLETMLELVSRVEPEFQEKVRHNITLAGGGSQIVGLGQALEQALGDIGGGRVQMVHDVVFAGADGGLALALDAVDADWEKLVV